LTRLAILASHPVQYYGPLFRVLAKRIDLHVFYAHRALPDEQGAAGFGTAFEWDVDLTEGYSNSFLLNVAHCPGIDRFSGCDTPEIGQRIKEGRFDAVLALGWHFKSMIQGIVAAKRLGLRTFVRGDSQLATPRSKVKTLLKAVTYPYLLQIFDAALYVGTHNRAYFEHYGYPSARLFYSPHCIETDRFAAGTNTQVRASTRNRFGIVEDEHVCLFAGKLLPFKRPLDVVEAVALLRAKGIKASVMVAGSGPMADEMQTRAASLNVPLYDQGFVNQSQMPSVYASSDVLCLPSTSHETWGLVCNEALACGLPIIVSDQVGSAPDLAGDNLVGRIFKMGNIDDLANALADSITKPAPKDAIAFVSSAFSMEKASDGIIEALRSISKKPPLSLQFSMK
jgi:glycosyltransferase involved in cell wall biosynthesis